MHKGVLGIRHQIPAFLGAWKAHVQQSSLIASSPSKSMTGLNTWWLNVVPSSTWVLGMYSSNAVLLHLKPYFAQMHMAQNASTARWLTVYFSLS